MNKNILILQNYINELLEKQNTTTEPLLKNTFSAKEYFNLLFPVLTIINNNSNNDLNKIYSLLFANSNLEEMVKHFIYQTQITPGIILEYKTPKRRETIICGNSQEIPYPKPMEEDTIFDIASNTKLITCIAILKLSEIGKLNLFDPISKYVPQFKNLTNVTIYDLLKFKVAIATDKRINLAKTKEEAEQILFTVHPKENQNLNNAYTDMGAMVLRYVIEKVSKTSYFDFTTEAIFKPLKMIDTHLIIPADKIKRVANENFSTTINADGSFITEDKNVPGTVHDPKAIVMGIKDGIAPGHAGIFSTSSDMLKLGSALANYTILKEKTILSMSENEVGGKYYNNSYSRFYGSLVFLKQLDPKFLGVYAPLSGKAFISPGFTGTTLCVDPLNKLTLYIAANRLHNRIYKVHPNQLANIKTSLQNKKTFLLANNQEKIVSELFTKEKEALVKKALDLTLQYQFLEKIYENNSNPLKPFHLVKKL